MQKIWKRDEKSPSPITEIQLLQAGDIFGNAKVPHNQKELAIHVSRGSEKGLVEAIQALGTEKGMWEYFSAGNEGKEFYTIRFPADSSGDYKLIKSLSSKGLLKHMEVIDVLEMLGIETQMVDKGLGI